jgi:protein-glutamine gamma-glutamyltransferase
MQFRYTLGALIGAALPCTLWLGWETSLLVFGVVALRYFTVRSNPKPWPSWLRVVLTVACTALVIAQFESILGRAPGGALLLSMLALKSTESASRRDARVLVTTALFVIVASFLMTQSVIALLFSLIGTALCFGALEVLSRPALGPRHSPFGRLGLADAGLLLTLAIPLTILLWLFVPRLATPLWGTQLGSSGRTGLSDTMRPGEITELLADDSPTMRIRFDGVRPNPSLLYFRGPVLWNLNELGEWSSNPGMRFNNAQRLEPRADDMRYRVTLEPNDQRFVFTADQGIAVSESARLSLESRFERFRPVNELLNYSAVSRLSTSIASASFPALQTSVALKLPPGNPQTRALAARWRAETQDPKALVAKALNYFQVENFSYDLSPLDITSLERVDDFLFRTREGYCEHYSGAFAFLMRAAGVPTRVVTGFTGGTYLDGADYLLIRNSDAHAWNEVYIDKSWIRVDPTSVLPFERIRGRRPGAAREDGALVNFLGMRDRIADWWNRTIVDFNAARQAELLMPFGIAQASWRDLFRVLGLGIVGIALIGALLLFLRRRGTLDPPATRAYRALLQSFAKRGLISKSHEAPQQVFSRATQHFPEQAQQIKQVAAQFNALTYQRDARTSSTDTTAEAAFLAQVRALQRDIKRQRAS